MSQFRADILNGSETVIGHGPLATISSVNTLVRLDEVGMATFAFPANDPRGKLVEAGMRFDLYVGEPAKYLGRFIYSSERIIHGFEGMSREVSAYNLLRELAHRTVGFRRAYVNIDVDVVVEDLTSVLPDWDTNLESGIGQTIVTYEGESVLAAIDVLRDRWSQHFRLDNPAPGHKILEFGAFGQQSGIRAIDAKGQVQHEILAHGNICLIERVGLDYESDVIFNRVIPLGAGQGVSQLTIEQATLGDYETQIGTNDDGSNYYYIEDAASVAAYGRVDKVLSFPNLRPITNSKANVENASNALKLTAEAYMVKHLAPRKTYTLAVRGLRGELKVGDTIRVTYRGLADTEQAAQYVYVDIDNDLYVLDIETSRSIANDTYEESVNLTVSTVSDRRTSDEDIMLDVIRDVRALKVHIAPTLASPRIGPYIRQIDSTHSTDFVVNVGVETMRLNYAKLLFRSRPFRTLASGVGSGGGTTKSSTTEGDHNHQMFATAGGYLGPLTRRSFSARDSSPPNMGIVLETSNDDDIYTFTNDGDHNHDVTLPNHTHSLSYGINDDATNPQSITLEINGVDVTEALGGPWADSNDPVEVEVDITDYLVNAIGGLQQDHIIEFFCGSGQGEIEFEVIMLTTIQAIAAF